MSDFKPSKYQKEIFKFITKGTGNGVISAVAGSGKTTTIIKSLELIDVNKTILFTAFNKDIAEEIKQRIPKQNNIDVKTLHGLGYNTLIDHFSFIEIDNLKYRKYMKDILKYILFKDNQHIKKYENTKISELIKNTINFIKENVIINEKKYTDYISNVIELTNFIRYCKINLDNKKEFNNKLKEISLNYSLPILNGEDVVVYNLINIGILDMKTIDFTDMIYLPIALNLEAKKYDFVMIDECQDLNEVQRILALKSLKKDGRFIAVGDPKQTIYGFAGSDKDSFNKLLSIPNTIKLDLSLSYRCPKEIVDNVRSINKDIKSGVKGRKGEIIRNFSYKNLQDGDMVLCRETFPTVSLCIKLISENKKATIIGKDIGKNLINLIKDCGNTKNTLTMDIVFINLQEKLDNMINELVEKNSLSIDEAKKDNYVVLLSEKIKIIQILSQNPNDLKNPYINDPNLVIEKINDIFKDKNKEGILLSTIHKAKGLEADRVFIIHDELIPSKHAKLGWQFEQEENLRYVAYTRPKKVLGFINDFDAFLSFVPKKIEAKNVIKSKHVGSVGMKMKFDLKVLNKRIANTRYGKKPVYDFIDENGNIYSKFGEIDPCYLKTYSNQVEVGSELSFYGIISSHDEFNGDKITKIGRIMLK